MGVLAWPLLAAALLAVPLRAMTIDQPDSLCQRGISLYDHGRYREAASCLDSALALAPDRLDIQYEKAMTLFALNDLHGSLSLCDRIIRADSLSFYQAYILKGSILDHLGEPEASISFYTRALQRFSSGYGLYYNRGVVYAREERYREAENDFILALNLNPEHTNSKYGLLQVLIARHQPGMAALAAYSYLLSDPGSERSPLVMFALMQLFGYIPVERAPVPPGRVIPPVVREDPAMIKALDSLVGAIARDADTSANAAIALYLNASRRFFSGINDVPCDRNTFWGCRYLGLLADLGRSEHLETFLFSAARTSWPGDTRPWLSAHRNRLDQLKTFVERYQQSYGTAPQ